MRYGAKLQTGQSNSRSRLRPQQLSASPSAPVPGGGERTPAALAGLRLGGAWAAPTHRAAVS